MKIKTRNISLTLAGMNSRRECTVRAVVLDGSPYHYWITRSIYNRARAKVCQDGECDRLVWKTFAGPQVSLLVTDGEEIARSDGQPSVAPGCARAETAAEALRDVRSLACRSEKLATGETKRAFGKGGAFHEER